MMAGMDNMTMDEMPDMASDEMPTLLMSKADDPRQQHYLPQSMMDDSACGYCVLLAHLPLDLTTFPPLQSGLVAKSVKPLPFYRPVISRFTPVFFHPRAPPDAA